MSDRFRSPSARTSADLSATFVSDTSSLVGGTGIGRLRFPAVLVPEGAERPGYPFVEFGELQGNDEPARVAGSSSPLYPATGHGLRAHRSSTEVRSQVRPARHEADSATSVGLQASDDARLPPRAGSPPAIARDAQGQLHDYAGDAIGAALRALAVPPAYDNLPELADLAVTDNRFAALPGPP